MTSLFKNLRIHQIFGANTDVGKTILSTALVRASAAKGKNVFYLKPISTGLLEYADDMHVLRYVPQKQDGFGAVRAECLFRFDDPVSPHLAAQLKSEKEGKSADSMIPSDETFVNSVAERIRLYALEQNAHGHMYVETAGGVHSPALSGTTQVDCYRPLFLPTILIGDSRLGGISSTISSYESLVLRGYIVDAVLLFQDAYYRNGEYLEPYFKERGVHLASLPPPPPKLPDPKENFVATNNYYTSITRPSPPGDGEPSANISDVVDRLDQLHEHRLEELASMPRRTLDTIWWPFVQHGLVKGERDVTVIDSAYGDFFSVTNKSSLRSRNERWCDPSGDAASVDEIQTSSPGSLFTSSNILNPQFDGSASWWTQTVGHSHPGLAVAAARASGRYGHVMFPQATHLPALKLAEHLVHDGPGKDWASRAFFSDNGSTGMEVALKMALRAYTSRHSESGELSTKEAKQRLGVLGLKGSYHGDTIGAMDATEEGVYTCEWHESKGYWLDPPTVGIQDSQVVITLPPSLSPASSSTRAQHQTPSLAWVYSVEDRMQTPLARAYAFHITKTLESLKQSGQHLGALVLEPLIMGAGGMVFVDPLFQRVLVDVVRGRSSSSKPFSAWSGLPVIFDEVFVGLNRLGMTSTSSVLGVKPDIAVYAKCLTGGLVPLCVTLASKSIFEAFVSSNKADALLHGHSYTAHAVGCEVANETTKLIEKLSLSDDWIAAKASWSKPDESESPVWSLWDRQFVRAISGLPTVKEVMTLGSVLAIRVQDSCAGYTSQSAQKVLQSLSWLSQSDEVLSAAPGGAPFNVHYRTLGDVAYFITSLNTRSNVIRSIEDKIWQSLSNA